MSDTVPALPDEMLDPLRRVGSLAVLTGAGISAESGVPTFRAAQTGLWARYRPEDLATPQAFRRDPTLVWDWYRWRKELVGKARPNAGHYALVTIEQHVPEFTLITQNVDGLHRRAGSRNVLELHGSLDRTRCVDCERLSEWPEESGELPRCPACGGLLRPDVVWFGEALPRKTLEQAVAAVSLCDALLVVGTSGLVQPAAALPGIAREQGATVVVINPEETEHVADADVFLRGSAGTVLSALVAAVWPSS